MSDTGYLLILFGKAFSPVDHQNTDVTSLDGSNCTDD